MATKLQTTTAIEQPLVVPIQKTELLLGLTPITDEMYSGKVFDSQADEDYTTKVSTTIAYALGIVKSGSQMVHSGIITNNTGATLPNGTKIFDYKTSEYRPSNEHIIGVNCYCNHYGIFLSSPLPNSSHINFSISLTPNSL